MVAVEGESGEGPWRSSAAMLLPGPGAADSDWARPATVTAEARQECEAAIYAPGIGWWQSSLIYRLLPERLHQLSVVRTVWEGPE